MRTSALVLLPVTLGVLLLVPQAAEAQYYGGGYRGGYGYGAPGPQGGGYRYRLHGYIGGQLTGLVTVGQTAHESVSGNGVGGYLGNGGVGGGIFGGVRLSPFFSLELSWNITWHQAASDYYYWSAFTLQTAELNGKIHIPTQSIVEPYIQLGVGVAFLGASWDDRYGYGEDWLLASGVDFNVGAGLDFWVSPFLTVGGRVLYKGMRFGTYRAAGIEYGANYASIVNVDLNLAFHF